MSAKETKTYRLGLVLAGGVSACGYTAGVLDYLFEALEKWNEVKSSPTLLKDKYGIEEPDGVPDHNVVIEVISGASGGSMCAAMLALSIAEGRLGKGKEHSKLYKYWVEMIDVIAGTDQFGNKINKGLLDVSDINDRLSFERLHSLLNVEPINNIMKDAAKYNPLGGVIGLPSYISENLDMYFTLANLEGIPYNICMNGCQQGNIVFNHADYRRFTLSNTPLKTPNQFPAFFNQLPYDSLPLELINRDTSENWKKHLLQTAKASGAFPFFLEPVSLSRNVVEYSQREWLVENVNFQKVVEPIPPCWNQVNDPLIFEYVDGGMLNNEPFEFARRRLAFLSAQPTNEGKYILVPNKRKGKDADRSVIMIDPFPTNLTNGGLPDELQNPSLLKLPSPLLKALMNQPKFSMEVLQLAMDDGVYSRYLIAPIREMPLGQPIPEKSGPLASGTLAGLSGFLSKKFREHDYQLGRRNCERFLSEHFTLPPNNPLFQGKRYQSFRDSKGNEIQIIPIFEKTEKVAPPWPRLKDKELGLIEEMFERRGKKLVDMAQHDIDNIFVDIILLFKEKKILKELWSDFVLNSLREYDLIK